tara:strand:+ start:130738 stop:131235 length:498 start_codon:yes stop_codon:yes gene_type:complete
MKSSRKALVLVGGILIAFFITGLYVIRQDLHEAMEQANAEKNYVPVEVSQFSNIRLTGPWKAHIRQGAAFEVEVSGSVASNHEVISDTLTLETTNSSYARITLPRLNELTVTMGGVVTVVGFEDDSLNVKLFDNSTFYGRENVLKYTSFDVQGNSQIKLIDDPFM